MCCLRYLRHLHKKFNFAHCALPLLPLCSHVCVLLKIVEKKLDKPHFTIREKLQRELGLVGKYMELGLVGKHMVKNI